LDSPRAATADLSSVEDFIVGGQKLPVEIAERLRDELGIALQQRFGVAEGMFLVTPRGAAEWVRHHTADAPISAADEVRILRPDAHDEVPDGELGELCVRVPYTICGYYRARPHRTSSQAIRFVPASLLLRAGRCQRTSSQSLASSGNGGGADDVRVVQPLVTTHASATD